MKGIIITASVMALTVGATPAALADLGVKNDEKLFRITLSGEQLPKQMGELTYPHQAAHRGRSGSCELLVVTDDQGNVGDHSVEECSSVLFRDTADEFAKTLKFRTDREVEHALTINWFAD